MGGKAIVVFVVLKIREKYVLYVQKYWGLGLWSGFIYRQSPPQQKISNKKGEEKIGKPVCVCVWKNKQEKEKRGGNG